MPPSNLLAALEALLFSSDQPLPLSLLAESLDASPERVAEALRELENAYAIRGAGVQVRDIAGGHLLVTAPEHAEWVGRLLRGKKRMRLSRAALESMAIVAYKQPVTKSEIEAIRGVDSSAVLATLLERNLVTIRGRSKVVGRPLLYGTTQEFLDYFGLRDLSELPRPEELRALVAAREPEQLDMMELEAPPLDQLGERHRDTLQRVTLSELEVVAQVGSDLPVSSDQHEVEPLGADDVDDAVAEELGQAAERHPD
jgi:segregation and condensation protein B